MLVYLLHEDLDVGNVTNLDVVALNVQLQDFEVVLERMSNNSFVAHDFLKNWCDVLEAWSKVKIALFNASDPLSVIQNCIELVVGVTWLNQSVKDDVSVVVDDADTCKAFSFGGEDSFAIECQDLSFSISKS